MNSKYPLVSLSGLVVEERETVGKIDGDGYPVFGVTNVDGITLTGVKRSADLSKYLRLKPHQFAYNPYRINVGSLGLSGAHQDGIVSPAYVVFAPKKHLDTAYLYYYLKSAEGNTQINYYGNRGSVRAALRFTDLCKMTIPLPPLSEQRRIVARIYKLLTKIAEAKKLRSKAIEEINLLLKTKDKTVFSGVDMALGEAADVTKLAGFEYTKHFANAPPGDVIVVRAGNVRNNGLRLYNSMTIPSEISNMLTRSQLNEGDVVMTFIGAKIGDVTFVNKGMPRLHCGPNVSKIRPSPKVSTGYLVKILQSFFVQQQIIEITKSTAQPNLSMKTIRQLRIMVPELDEQEKIVSYLSNLQVKIDSLKKLQEQTAAELDALLPSILDKAFKGQL